MKKRFVLTLVIVFVLAIASTAFAATNPFEDVPAKHWSYDAVAKLAKVGIVDGYSDNTFKGDKTMTRYEMATIIAKALARSEKADAESKALVDKLVIEYAKELDNLGVRVDNLGKKVDKFTINPSTLRLRFDTNKTGDVKTTDEHVNMDLKFAYKVNDNWSIQGESEWQRGLNQGSVNKKYRDEFEQLYVTGPIGGSTVKAGRFSYAPIYGLVYDDKVTGGQVAFGNKVITTLTAGKATSADEIYDTGAVGVTKVTGKKDDNYFSTVFETAASKVTNVKAGYFRFTRGDFANNNTNNSVNIYTLGFDSQVAKDLNLRGVYAKSNYNGLLNKAAWAKVTYKTLDYSVPKSYDIFATYRYSAGAAQYSNTDDWIVDTKGWRVGFDYVFDKNIGMTAWYTDGKGITGTHKDVKEKKYRAEFDFKF